MEKSKFTYEFTDQTTKHYDESLGYGSYYEWCVRESPRTGHKNWTGLTKVNILPEDMCKVLRDALDSNDPILNTRKFKLSIISYVFNNPEVDQALVNCFGTEYLPLWLNWYRNDPMDKKRDPSMRWHCDGGPSRHAKILIYLNGSEESGGNTLFLSSKTTNELKAINYIFCPLDERLADLTKVAKHYNIDYEIINNDISEGEGYIFEPFSIAHKGIWPTRTTRYIIQMCILPAGKPWDIEITERDIPRENNAWPPWILEAT